MLNVGKSGLLLPVNLFTILVLLHKDGNFTSDLRGRFISIKLCEGFIEDFIPTSFHQLSVLMCTATSQYPSTSYVCLGTRTRTWIVVQKVCLSSLLQNIAMWPIVLKWHSGRNLPCKDVQVILIPLHKYFSFFLRLKDDVNLNISHTNETLARRVSVKNTFYLPRSASFTLGRNSLRSVEGYALSYVSLFCKLLSGKRLEWLYGHGQWYIE